MIELKERHCVGPDEEILPLDNSLINLYKERLSPRWFIYQDKKLVKEFPFENYKRVMAFAQKIAAIAEKENHHPTMCLSYSGVKVEFTTHDVDGLSENDFIMAAKIDEI